MCVYLGNQVFGTFFAKPAAQLDDLNAALDKRLRNQNGLFVSGNTDDLGKEKARIQCAVVSIWRVVFPFYNKPVLLNHGVFLTLGILVEVLCKK